MLPGLRKPKNSKDPSNYTKSLHGTKSLPQLQNIIGKTDVVERNISNSKIKTEEATEETLNLISTRTSIQRSQSSSKLTKTSCTFDFKEALKPKSSAQIIHKTREEQRYSKGKTELVDETINIPYKNYMRESEGFPSNLETCTSSQSNSDEDLCNFELENLAICNKESKTKYKLNCYTQSGPRNWQSQWKEFEAEIKKNVGLIESLLQTCDFDTVVKHGIEVLKKLNMFCASLKQKYPYRSRLYYCLGKSYLAVGHHQGSFKCSIELLHIGDILKDNKIVYNGYNIACKTYTKIGQYRQAAELWQKMINMEENLTERAKLYHKIGKWYFKLFEWDIANSFGKLCLTVAVKASSNEWCMKAHVLIGKSALKLHNCKEALNALYNARHYKALVYHWKKSRLYKKL